MCCESNSVHDSPLSTLSLPCRTNFESTPRSLDTRGGLCLRCVCAAVALEAAETLKWPNGPLPRVPTYPTPVAVRSCVRFSRTAHRVFLRSSSSGLKSENLEKGVFVLLAARKKQERRRRRIRFGTDVRARARDGLVEFRSSWVIFVINNNIVILSQ